jgi:hypothetical protein
MSKSLLISLCLVCVLSTALLAGNSPNAKLAIHVRLHNAKAGCGVTITGCGDIVGTYAGDNIDVFPVFFDLNEYKGCSYSLDWPDWTYSAAFTNCADFVIGGIYWPGNTQYAAHAWTACETGVCVPAFLWLYADGPGQICPLDPEPLDLRLSVLDCEEGEDTPTHACCAGVNGMAGDDPCDCPPWENPTVPATWSAIKSLFE